MAGDHRRAGVPCLRLFSEALLVEDEGGNWAERELAVCKLEFDYDGKRVPLLRQRDPFAVDQSQLNNRLRSTGIVARDLAAEARAQSLLERFGAVEVDCLESVVVGHDSRADYVVNPDANVHALCSFSAHALSELTKLGWRVDVADDYPFEVITPETQWYAQVRDDEERDWFSLELGVELGQGRVDLLPALVELVSETSGDSLRSLCRHAAKYRAFPLGNGRYLALSWERLERILSVLAELYREGSDRLSQHAVASLGRLDDAFEAAELRLSWSGATRRVKQGRALAAKPGFSPTPGSLRAELRSYQEEGLAWLEHLRKNQVAGILADDMGLGKTLQTIAQLCSEKEHRRSDRPSLIVAPKSLIENWRRELNRFAPHLRVGVFSGSQRKRVLRRAATLEVIITSYPILVRETERLGDLSFHYLILDEAQAIKNPRSLAFRAVRDLEARHRLCLTGTPVENNLQELWAQFDFLMPGLLGNARQFNTGFRQPIEVGGDAQALLQLQDRVGPFILRRVKEDVLKELPPKTELVQSVEITAAQRDLYESIRVAAHGEVRSAIRQRGLTGASIAILDALTKLRQVCCDPRLVSVDAARGVNCSAKRDFFVEFVSQQLAEGRRILVFSQFAKMLGLLSEELGKLGISHGVLTGATDRRQELVDRFQSNEMEVFLISLKAGGTGLNLTRADTVIHYDPWWNAAAQSQATDRAYRFGQQRPVFAYNFVVAGSVEERILLLQKKKRLLADTLLSSSRGSSSLSQDEVDDLFAPLI